MADRNIGRILWTILAVIGGLALVALLAIWLMMDRA
jgi:phage shock protein PspC (stress-responsive transcriptional regulator)